MVKRGGTKCSNNNSNSNEEEGCDDVSRCVVGFGGRGKEALSPLLKSLENHQQNALVSPKLATLCAVFQKIALRFASCCFGGKPNNKQTNKQQTLHIASPLLSAHHSLLLWLGWFDQTGLTINMVHALCRLAVVATMVMLCAGSAVAQRTVVETEYGRVRGDNEPDARLTVSV